MQLNARALTGERWLSLACIAATLIMASLFFFVDLLPSMRIALASGHYGGLAEAVGFACLVILLIYGSLVHQVARLGWIARLSRVPPAAAADPGAVVTAAVTVLVPAYREEPDVVRRTLLSAALQAHGGFRLQAQRQLFQAKRI